MAEMGAFKPGRDSLSALCGMTTGRSRNRLAPRLTHCARGLPISASCRSSRARRAAGPRPASLRRERPEAGAAVTDSLWQAFLRRFDIAALGEVDRLPQPVEERTTHSTTIAYP